MLSGKDSQVDQTMCTKASSRPQPASSRPVASPLEGGRKEARGQGGVGGTMRRSRSGPQSVLSRTVAGPLLNRPPPAATAAQLQLGGEGGGGCGGGGWGWQET